jgi:hypothetical protein
LEYELRFYLTLVSLLEEENYSLNSMGKLLGEYNFKSIEEPKEFNDVITKIYLHTYSSNSYKIEIVSTPTAVFSFFGNISPPETKEFYDLQSRATEEKEGILKFKLANLKTGMFGIVLIHSENTSVLILPTKEMTTFTKRRN